MDSFERAVRKGLTRVNRCTLRTLEGSASLSLVTNWPNPRLKGSDLLRAAKAVSIRAFATYLSLTIATRALGSR